MKEFNLIASGGKNPGINTILLSNNKLKIEKIFQSQYGKSIYRVTLSPDQSKYAFADKYGKIQVYNLQNNQLILQFLYLCKQVPMITGLTFAGNNMLAAAGSDFQIRIYDLSTNKIAKIIKAPGYIFGLTAINKEQLCGICRDQSGDHLYVWDINIAESIFIGPSFKIANFYLNTAIDIDGKRGLVAHGDRLGNLHIYKIAEHFNHTQFDTGHGNFYGVLFTAEYLFTGGATDNKIKCWDIDEQKLVNELTLPASVIRLSRLNTKHLVASLSNDQLVLLETEKLKILSSVFVPDVRDIAFQSLEFIQDMSWQNRVKEGKELLAKIQSYFEEGKAEQAYQALNELEGKGFRKEALEALCIAENAQGRILSELEALFILTSQIEITEESLIHFERLAEILEIINEPESAINIYTILSSKFELTEKYQNKIEELSPLCLEDTDKTVAIDGDRTPDFVRAEIRKAEILNRFFEEPIVFGVQKLKILEDEISLSDFVANMNGKEQTLFLNCSLVDVIFRIGSNSIITKIARINPFDPNLSHCELWIELQKHMNDTYPIIRKMFIPGSNNGSDEWNYNLIHQFNNTIENSLIEKWFNKSIDLIESALITSAKSDEFEWE